MSKKLEPEELYHRLKAAIETAPDLKFKGPPAIETVKCMARVHAAIKAKDPIEAVAFKFAMDRLSGRYNDGAADEITGALLRAFYDLELNGSFSNSGASGFPLGRPRCQRPLDK